MSTSANMPGADIYGVSTALLTHSPPPVSDVWPPNLDSSAIDLTNLDPAGGTYFEFGFGSPLVFYDTTDAKYKMWVTAYGTSGRGSITYTQSDAPGAGWVVNNTPVLTHFEIGFDKNMVGNCSVIENIASGKFEMWYSGWSSRIAIGFADSDEGLVWEKYRK